MATLTLDTHQFIKQLVQVGVPEKQAEAIANGFQDLNLEEVATKRDLQELRTELREVREELRVEIRDIKIDFLKWMIPLMLGQIPVFAFVVEWLLV